MSEVSPERLRVWRYGAELRIRKSIKKVVQVMPICSTSGYYQNATRRVWVAFCESGEVLGHSACGIGHVHVKGYALEDGNGVLTENFRHCTINASETFFQEACEV